MITPRPTVALLIAIGATGIAGSVTELRPRPARLTVTARVDDDTVVINQTHLTKLINSSVRDQYGRLLRSDTAVRYQRISGDSLTLSSSGDVRCDRHGDAVVRAAFAMLAKVFVLRCRPVARIEAPTWLDLVAGDSTRELSFTARGPDGRAVTELRGAITVENASIVALEGAAVRPKRPGITIVVVEIGDAMAQIPIMVYRPVKSFVDNPSREDLLAMRVRLARGDTVELPVPKAAFWVTYLASDPHAAPPTIELRGDGVCTTGDGIRLRRIEDGKYAKYCLVGSRARMMIAHGTTGADTVTGTVAVRVMP
ncbi:MAG TPA: hypothetical protein VK679_03275 [Gemmatimonadaceae bacterium]|jgi:hypothetical protein|nr:hypothetical protein [Gemmatimonadaceae bacterium]